VIARIGDDFQASEVFMSQTLDAIFDGSVFRPDQPIELEPNTRVRITIEPATISAQESQSFLRVAQSLNLDGPPDWSSHIDEYLYGGNRTLDE
jgi:predicted DNA-binding antitoxin AbrB/MazE fold protein